MLLRIYAYQIWAVFWTLLGAALVINFVLSLILFIKDGKKAKKEGRIRKSGITSYFVVFLVLFSVAAAFALLLFYIASTVVFGM